MASKQQPREKQSDTIVVGGGIVGLCASWFLARAGVSVLCLDAGHDCGSAANAGSLHGQMQSRMERQFPKRVEQYQKTLSMYPRAIDYWADVARQLGVDIEYRITGGLMVAESRQQMAGLASKRVLERRHGITTSLLDQKELLQMAPYLTQRVHGALYCEKEGKVNPLLATAAVRLRAIKCGATVRKQVCVERIEPARSGYHVTTRQESFLAGRVVIAAGSGSGALARTLGLRLPCTAEPLQMSITEPAGPLLHHLIQHAAKAITIKQLDTGQVLIGGGWPAAAGCAGAPPTVLSDSLAGNLRLAHRLAPAIGGLRLQRSWAGVNTLVDLVSVLGPVASLPGIHFAVPGDAGYTLGPYCARLVVDAMLGHAPDYPLHHFSPNRF